MPKQNVRRGSHKHRFADFEPLESRCLLSASMTNAANPNPSLIATLPIGMTDFVENAAGTTIYATVPSLGEVVFLDEASLTVLTTVSVGTHPNGLSLSTDGTKLFVADSGTNNVDVINTSTGAIETPLALPGGSFPTDVQTGTNNRLWVLTGGTLRQIDATTGASTGASIGVPAGDIRITPNGSTILAANYGDSPSQLDAVNVSGATPTTLYTVYPGSNGEDLELSADGSTFVLVCGGGNNTGDFGYPLDTYNVTDGSSHSTVQLGTGAFAFSKDGTIGYAGQTDNDTIHAFPLTRDSSGVLDLNGEEGSIQAANPAQKMFSSSTGLLLVGEGSETQIFGVATSTSTTPGTGTGSDSQTSTPVGPQPSAVYIAQSPKNGTRGVALNKFVVDVDYDNKSLISDPRVAASKSTVTLKIASGPAGAMLEGITTVNAVKGVATFSDIIPNMAGSYTFTAVSTGLASSTTTKITKVARPVTPAVPTHLVFAQTPVTTTVGAVIAPAILVYVEDANGNIVTTDDSTVKLAIRTGPGAGTIVGTLTVVAQNGVANFHNVALTVKGKYRLIARDGSLVPVTSAAFAIKKK